MDGQKQKQESQPAVAGESRYGSHERWSVLTEYDRCYRRQDQGNDNQPKKYGRDLPQGYNCVVLSDKIKVQKTVDRNKRQSDQYKNSVSIHISKSFG